MAIKSVSRPDTGALKPAAQAFLLALLSTAGPRALSALVAVARRKTSLRQASSDLDRLLRQELSLNSFPNFCAIVVGGSISLQQPLQSLLLAASSKLHVLSSYLDAKRLRIVARFVAAIISSAVAFHLINTNSTSSRSGSSTTNQHGSSTSRNSKNNKVPDNIPPLPSGIETLPPRATALVPLAGRTMDLTIFTAVRAIDAMLSSSPSSSTPQKSTRLQRLLAQSASPGLFILSSAIIMHAFFYAPLRLPRTYVSWIQRIAHVDPRLVHALRQVRYGNFIYGKDTGIAPLLGSMARDLGLPEEWGDPAKTIPVPCELVHHGMARSCEGHALKRLGGSLRAALAVYAPLQAVLLVRRLASAGAPKGAAARLRLVVDRLLDTLRSASFLASFIALFYYGVCLARTRLGPKLFPGITAQMWDGGLCILAGCCACGWSVLVEKPKRQMELMLFVVPRAVSVFMPRRYEASHRWKEHIAFTLSSAILLTIVQTRPDKVRGVFGGLLSKVMTA